MKTQLSRTLTGPKPFLNVNLRVFVYPGLLLLLFFPPFFRGLFFAPELLTTHLYTAVLFALCWYDKLVHRDARFIGSGFDIVMGLYVLAYFFSLIGALNMRGAVGEVLKVINYFMVFWITTQVIKQEQDIKALLKAIYFGAVGVALVGIGAAIGLLKYPGAMVGNRIYSTLQYPNTLAAFLTVGVIIGLVLLVRSEKALPKFLYTLGNLPLMIVILGSQSRGSWLMLPVVLTLLLIGLPKSYRFATLVNLVLTTGVALQVYRSMLPGFESGAGKAAVKFLFLGAIVVLALQALYLWAINFLEIKQVTLRTRKLLAGGVLVYAAAVLLVYVVYSAQVLPSVTAQFVSPSLIKRAQTIDNTNINFINRLDYSKTAFKIALDYPINGTGGEGWNALYHRYMPYLDWTSEVHNNFGKVLVETGFIGLGLFLGLWLMFLKNLALIWRENPEDDSWALVWAAGMAALALGIHSAYDFDLSMAAMSIILFALFGISEGAKRLYLAGPAQAKKATPRGIGIAFIAGTLGALLLFIPSYRLYAAGVTGAEGARAMKAKDWVKAEAKLLQAKKLDPFSASYSGDLAQVYTVQGLLENSPAKFKLADQYAQEAIKQEPYNYKLRTKMVLMYLLQQNIDQAVKEAEAVLAVNPLYMPSYEVLGRVYVGAGKHFADRGQADKAKLYWQKALTVPDLIAKKKASLAANPPYWKGIPLEVTPQVTLVKGQAQYFLGDYGAAKETLNSIKDNPQVKAEVKLYLEAMK